MSRRPTCDALAGCNWQHSATSPSASPAHLRWIADISNLLEMQIEFRNFQPFWPLNMDRIVDLVRCDRRWCSHKISSSPITAGLPTSQASRRSMCRRLMFTYVAALSQAVPAAMPQVCRWHMRTRLKVIPYYCIVHPYCARFSRH